MLIVIMYRLFLYEGVDDFELFDKELTEFLNIISTTGQSFICGDFNINLLKILTKPNYNTFFQSMLAHGISLKSQCQLEYVSLVVHL